MSANDWVASHIRNRFKHSICSVILHDCDSVIFGGHIRNKIRMEHEMAISKNRSKLITKYYDPNVDPKTYKFRRSDNDIDVICLSINHDKLLKKIEELGFSLEIRNIKYRKYISLDVQWTHYKIICFNKCLPTSIRIDLLVLDSLEPIPIIMWNYQYDFDVNTLYEISLHDGYHNTKIDSFIPGRDNIISNVKKNIAISRSREYNSIQRKYSQPSTANLPPLYRIMVMNSHYEYDINMGDIYFNISLTICGNRRKRCFICGLVTHKKIIKLSELYVHLQCLKEIEVKNRSLVSFVFGLAIMWGLEIPPFFDEDQLLLEVCHDNDIFNRI